MKSMNETQIRTHETKYYDQTEYPNLYIKVYWGGFRGIVNDIIIKNRNRLVKDYGITKEADGSDRRKRRLFDLLFYENENDGSFINYKKSEYYKDKDFKEYYLYYQEINIIRYPEKWIKMEKYRKRHNEYYKSKKYPGCIIHFFSDHISKEKDYKLIIDDGYKEIYPIYSPRQKTFVKIAPLLKKDYGMINTIEYPEQETI